VHAALESAGLADLERRSARSAAVTVGAQAARLALSLAGTAALARLLEPRDFGLVAMAAAALALLTGIREMGLSVAIVQREHVSHAQVSTLFWINAAFSLVLALALSAAAPALAWLYGEPRVAPIAVALAATLPLGGVAAQHRALLQRRMAFRTLAACDVAALVVGTSAGVALAVGGAGPWALVALPLASEATATALVWRACRWRPGAPRRGAGVRSLLAFGGDVTLASALQHAARHLDKVLVGWACGAAPLGLYGRAQQLVLLPLLQINAPLSAVAVPALSRLQGDPARFRRFYLTALRQVALAALPLLAAIAVLARELVAVVLGPAWGDAAPIVAVLACAGAVQILGNTAGWLFVSRARTRVMLAWNALASAALLAAFAIGLPWGALGVAGAYAVCVWALRVPHFAMALRGGPVSGRDVWRAVYRPLALAALAAAAMAAAHAAAAPRDIALRIAATLGAGALAWGGALAAWPGARADAAELLAALRALRPPAAPRAAAEQRS
jgi:O-antigen/teichoic acid export membrane protein